MGTATVYGPETRQPHKTLGSRAASSPVVDPWEALVADRPIRGKRIHRGDRIEFLARIAFLMCIFDMVLAVGLLLYELLVGVLP